MIPGRQPHRLSVVGPAADTEVGGQEALLRGLDRPAGARGRTSLRALVCVAIAALSISGCSGSHRVTNQVSACGSVVDHEVLPRWARRGFSDAQPNPPHVFSASHQMVAVLFGDPLTSPPPRRRSNKILWISQAPTEPGSDLRLSAQRIDGARLVRPIIGQVVVGGPGPSVINMPAPGCWRLTLRWSGRTDTIDLRYAPGA